MRCDSLLLAYPIVSDWISDAVGNSCWWPISVSNFLEGFFTLSLVPIVVGHTYVYTVYIYIILHCCSFLFFSWNIPNPPVPPPPWKPHWTLAILWVCPVCPSFRHIKKSDRCLVTVPVGIHFHRFSLRLGGGYRWWVWSAVDTQNPIFMATRCRKCWTVEPNKGNMSKLIQPACLNMWLWFMMVSGCHRKEW